LPARPPADRDATWRMTIIAIPIAALLVVGGLLFVLGRTPQAVQLGSILLGAGLALGAAFTIENWKRYRLTKDLASALYYELANRVARCWIDFDAPWAAHWHQPPRVDRFAVSKFLPEPWTIFKANADKIALFPVEVPAALMGFYFRLWVVDRDIAKAREEGAAGKSDDIGSGNVQLIASRFAATLRPGKEALEALGGLVREHATIDANALSTLDPHKLRFIGTLRELLATLIERADAIRVQVEGNPR
jgi:hypothetical protein